MWEGFKQGKTPIVLIIAGLAMAIYHMVYTQVFLQDNVPHLNTHLGFCLLLVFLDLFVKSKRRFQTLALLGMVLLTVFALGYVQIFWRELQENAYFNTPFELVIGVIIIFLVLEATRREFGLFLPVLSLAIALYPFVGQHLPEPFRCTAYPVDQTISNLSIGLANGIYGVVLPTSANYIFLFVLFGGVLQALGGTKFFVLAAKLVVRKVQGGPGLVAVLWSSIIGSITASAAADIAIMGPFTIPFMKKHGYKPEYAGAIEAASSTGGLIMPPIMGMVAFGMAGITGIPYIKIAIMAIVPALLYYFALGLYVYLRAGQLRIPRLPPEKIDVKEMLYSAPIFVIPFCIIIFLLIKGHTVMYTAFWTIVSAGVIAFLRKKRPPVKDLIRGFVEGARGGAAIGVSAACVGPILATFTMTGLGVKISSGIQIWSGGNLFLALVIIAAIIVLMGCLGAALTAYLVTSIFAVPALVKMGIDFERAHFFAMYISNFAFLTPPVAMAALIASKLAEASYVKTAAESVKSALGGFTIPFLLVYCPLLLLLPQDPVRGAAGLACSVLFLFSMEITFVGYYLRDCSILERIFTGASGTLFFLSVVLANLSLLGFGLALLVLITLSQWRKKGLAAAYEVTKIGT
jgi:TRAP transporter 4TM/12TM fusion protein